MGRLVNEAYKSTIDRRNPNEERKRSVDIREQIHKQKTVETHKRTWWQRCYDSCCYHDEQAATYPIAKLGRGSIQMTCPSCQNRIRTRLKYLVGTTMPKFRFVAIMNNN